MANLNDELNKAAKEFKEIIGNLKSSEKTKDAVQELQEIKEQIEKSSSSNLKEIKQFKEETKERITKSAVYDEEATNRSIFSAKSLFSCSGRLGKIGYGVINVLLYILLVSIMYGLFRLERYTRAYTIVDMLILITYAGFCTLYIIALIRRLHDCGKNGVPTLLAIPLLVMCHSYGYDWHMAPFYIGIVVALIMFIQPGTDDDNAYGPVPPEFSLQTTIDIELFKNKLNLLKEKIVWAISTIVAYLKCYKKIIILGFGIIAALGCIGIYLYIPKVSDVEEYKANHDVANLTKLIDETTESQSFLDVRSEAIKALLLLNDAKGEDYVENILHKRYEGSELRDEIIRCGIEVDKDFILNRVKKYRYTFGEIDDESTFRFESKPAYDKMLYLAEIAKDNVALDYTIDVIGVDCVNFIREDIFSTNDVRSYLIEHIGKYGNLFPNPNLAKNFAVAIKNYDNCIEDIKSAKNSIKSLEEERRTIINKQRDYLYGYVTNKYGNNFYDVNVGYGRIVTLQTIETEYFTKGYISLPVHKTGYDTFVEDTSAKTDGERVFEIYKLISRWEKVIKEHNSKIGKLTNEVKLKFSAFESSVFKESAKGGNRKNLQLKNPLGLYMEQHIKEQPVNFEFKLASGWALIYSCADIDKLKFSDVLPLDKAEVTEFQVNTKHDIVKELQISIVGDSIGIVNYLCELYGGAKIVDDIHKWTTGDLVITYFKWESQKGLMMIRTKEFQDYLEKHNM